MRAAKILIIEDDLQIRTMLERFLVAQGHTVVSASDGIVGIRVFSSEKPDLVLLDMLLPKLLGTDVCDMMKRSVEGSSVPIVMMSAVMKADNFQKDFRGKRRPDAFLVKPFQFAEMGRVVSALLAGRKVEEEPLDGLEVLEVMDRTGSGVISLADAGVFDLSQPYGPFAAIAGEGSAARTRLVGGGPGEDVPALASPPQSPPPAPSPPSPGSMVDDLTLDLESPFDTALGLQGLEPVAPTPPAVTAPPASNPFAAPPRPASAAGAVKPPPIPRGLGMTPPRPASSAGHRGPSEASRAPRPSRPLGAIAAPLPSENLPPWRAAPLSPTIAELAATREPSRPPPLPYDTDDDAMAIEPLAAALSAPPVTTTSSAEPPPHPVHQPPPIPVDEPERPPATPPAPLRGASPRVVARAADEPVAAPGANTSAHEFDDLLEDVRRALDDVASDEHTNVADALVVDSAPLPSAQPATFEPATFAAPPDEPPRAFDEPPRPAPPFQPTQPPAHAPGPLAFPAAVPSLPGQPVSVAPRALGRVRPRAPSPGLKEMTVPELLFLLYRRMFSGVLRMEREGAAREIFCLNGHPVHVRSDVRAETLGRHLVQMGRLSEEAYLAALQRMEQEQRTAPEVIVDMGLVSAQELTPVLRALDHDNLLRTFGWDGAVYELERGAEHVVRVPIFEQNPIAVVAEGLAEWCGPAELEAEWRTLAPRFVRATADFGKHLPVVEAYLPQHPYEWLLDGTRRVQDLLAASADDELGMMLAMKTFRTLNMLELAPLGGTGPVVLAAPPAAAAPSRAAPLPVPQQPTAPPPAIPVDRDLEERILRTYLTLRGQTHYEVLGVAVAARPDELDAAYSSRAQAFHPDNLQYVASSEARAKAKEIFTALGQAYEVLRDPARRAAYTESLARAPRPIAAQGNPAAEQEHRKGMRFMEMGNFANAVVAFTNALRSAPNEPDYYLMLGWAMYQNYRTSGNEPAITRAVGFVRKAITLAPQDDRAFYYLGCIYRDRGQTDLARQLLTRALNYNPQNLNARRVLDEMGPA